MTYFNNPDLDEAIKALILEKNIASDRLTRDQLAEAFKQALAAGDFTRIVVKYSDAQQVIYLPYQEVERLRREVARLKTILDTHGIPHTTYEENTKEESRRPERPEGHPARHTSQEPPVEGEEAHH